MDDNARPHRARIVREFRQEAIDTFQWLAMSHDMNPIEHIWDFILTVKWTNVIHTVEVLLN
jgi:transposase